MQITKEQRDAWADKTRNSPFNLWLRGQVSDSAGALDLAKLRQLAAEYGIDAAKYLHLNPGQQRMNIGNRLRKLVPEHIYATGQAAGLSLQAATIDVVDERGAAAPASSATAALGSQSTHELMRLYGDIVDALRARGVVRTGNAPLGDYAEYLFAKAFGWSLAGNSASGYDATDAAGLRFQIKSRRLRSNAPAERQLSTIRAISDTKFDMLAAVLFDRHFNVHRAALIPYAVVVQRSAYIAHVNGWRFVLDDAVWDIPGVRDVTSALTVSSIS